MQFGPAGSKVDGEREAAAWELLTGECLMAWRRGDCLAAAALAQRLLYMVGDLRDQLLGEAAAGPDSLTWEQIGASFGMDPDEARAQLEGGFPESMP